MNHRAASRKSHLNGPGNAAWAETTKKIASRFVRELIGVSGARIDAGGMVRMGASDVQHPSLQHPCLQPRLVHSSIFIASLFMSFVHLQSIPLSGQTNSIRHLFPSSLPSFNLHLIPLTLNLNRHFHSLANERDICIISSSISFRLTDHQQELDYEILFKLRNFLPTTSEYFFETFPISPSLRREEPKNNIQSSKINETSEPSQTLPESICPVNRNTYQTLLPSFEKGKSTFNSNDQ